MNEEFMSDEEKSYHQWVSKNISFLNQHKASISAMKKVYMDGFAAGFTYKNKINAEEQLQK